MVWWAWIVLGAGLLAAEIVLSTDFYLVFFGLSGLLLGLVLAVGVPLPAPAQWLIYAAVAAGSLLFYRMKIRARFLSPSEERGPELVGEKGTAREPIAPGERGRVELRGSTWIARNDGDAALDDGGRCVVAGVDGLTLFVRRED